MLRLNNNNINDIITWLVTVDVVNLTSICKTFIKKYEIYINFYCQNVLQVKFILSRNIYPIDLVLSYDIDPVLLNYNLNHLKYVKNLVLPRYKKSFLPFIDNLKTLHCTLDKENNDDNFYIPYKTLTLLFLKCNSLPHNFTDQLSKTSNLRVLNLQINNTVNPDFLNYIPTNVIVLRLEIPQFNNVVDVNCILNNMFLKNIYIEKFLLFSYYSKNIIDFKNIYNCKNLDTFFIRFNFILDYSIYNYVINNCLQLKFIELWSYDFEHVINVIDRCNNTSLANITICVFQMFVKMLQEKYPTLKFSKFKNID